jgi:nanoRNase/pAp phosphatase (c-di-AMP/oligoRNAs hydrolase)
MNYLATGVAPGREGHFHPNLAPYQVVPCADGHMILATGNDAQYRRFCAVIGREDLAAAPEGSSEGLIDLLRTAEGTEVALVLRPGRDGGWRGSLRSRGTVDVGRVAAALGGGGHRLAAGFDAVGSAAEVVARVVDLLREA